ncbi:MAG: YraN family protein, partial [Planctomycetes bacterium]|nr:YraN family protein [Planctomycetota bacterium]
MSRAPRTPRRSRPASKAADPTGDAANETAARPGSGAHGEQLAGRALARVGLRVVARNVRTRHGEIDLLCRRGRVWIAVEVKARRDHPAPERCVRPEQLERIERALRSLAPSLRPRPRELRIDVVTVRWRRPDRSGRSPADLHHFPAFLRLRPAGDGIGFSRVAPGDNFWAPSYSDGSRTLPTSMVTLAEQMIPRRKMLLLLSENLLFVLVILVGTSVPPLS